MRVNPRSLLKSKSLKRQLLLMSLLQHIVFLDKFGEDNSQFSASLCLLQYRKPSCQKTAFVFTVRNFTVSTWRHGLHVFRKLAADAVIIGADVMETPS